MSKPSQLTLVYLGLAVLWQALLLSVMPNIGMGGIAIVYFVWPLVTLSAVCLWFVLRALPKGRTTVFVTSLTLMLFATVALHPQDSPISFSQKLGAVFR